MKSSICHSFSISVAGNSVGFALLQIMPKIVADWGVKNGCVLFVLESVHAHVVQDKII